MTIWKLNVNGDTVQYEDERKLGEGGTGTVYLVQGVKDGKKEPKKYAMKVAFPQFRENLKQQWNNIDQTKKKIKHYVKFYHLGETSEQGDSGDTTSAIVMDYAGWDLSYVMHQLLPKVGDQVKEAFQYKVLCTLVESLEDAHKKERLHKDVKFRNISCGLQDIPNPEALDVSDLEKALIDSRIQVLDPENDEVQAINSLLYSREDDLAHKALLDNNYCNNGRSPLDEEKDIYALVAIYARFIYGNTDDYVTEFSENHLGVKFSGGGKRTYPSLKIIREKIEAEMKENELEEKNKYFQRDTVTVGKVSYPIVTRPVDRLRRKIDSRKSDSDPYHKDKINPLFNLYQMCCQQAAPVVGKPEEDACTQLIIKNFQDTLSGIENDYSVKRDNLLKRFNGENAVEVIETDEEELKTMNNNLQTLSDRFSAFRNPMQQEYETLLEKNSQDKNVWEANDSQHLVEALHCICTKAKELNLIELENAVLKKAEELKIPNFQTETT